MWVDKEWLEAQVQELNQYLQAHQTDIHFEYAEKKRKRDNYVNKLIELEQSGKPKIKI